MSKIEYVDLDAPAITKKKDDYRLGEVFISERGHEVTIVALGADEITFGFTRSFKGETEKRQRSVPLDRVRFFLKAYR